MTSSMMVFLSLGSGPLVAILIKQFGHRNIALIGEQSFLPQFEPLFPYLVMLVSYGVRSPKFIWAPLCTAVPIGWDPATPSPHLGSYMRRVSYTYLTIIPIGKELIMVMQLDLQRLFGLLCTAVLIGWDPATSPPPQRIWAHIRGRYWSAKIEDISLWPQDIPNKEKYWLQYLY
jgi:hypothetical protein